MEKSNVVRLGVFAIAMAVAVAGTPDVESFSVASIRPNPPRDIVWQGDNFTPFLPGGRFIDEYATTMALISWAYNIPLPYQIEGLPTWADSLHYAVSAKADESYSAPTAEGNKEHIRSMLRTLLADRFHLQIHTEMRQKKGLGLQLARGGLKLKAVPAPIPPAFEGYVSIVAGRNGSGTMRGKTVTMADLAKNLTGAFGQPVVDDTGIQLYYDITINWSGSGRDTPAAFDTDFVQGAISALQADIGVHFVRKTVPVQYWVVSHIEKPTPN